MAVFALEVQADHGNLERRRDDHYLSAPELETMDYRRRKASLYCTQAEEDGISRYNCRRRRRLLPGGLLQLRGLRTTQLRPHDAPFGILLVAFLDAQPKASTPVPPPPPRRRPQSGPRRNNDPGRAALIW
jgi:hypothetical protein